MRLSPGAIGKAAQRAYIDPMENGNSQRGDIMYAINQIEKQSAVNLKHQLVATISRGDQIVAEELRMLLRLNAPEVLRGMPRD